MAHKGFASNSIIESDLPKEIVNQLAFTKSGRANRVFITTDLPPQAESASQPKPNPSLTKRSSVGSPTHSDSKSSAEQTSKSVNSASSSSSSLLSEKESGAPSSSSSSNNPLDHPPDREPPTICSKIYEPSHKPPALPEKKQTTKSQTPPLPDHKPTSDPKNPLSMPAAVPESSNSVEVRKQPPPVPESSKPPVPENRKAIRRTMDPRSFENFHLPSESSESLQLEVKAPNLSLKPSLVNNESSKSPNQMKKFVKSDIGSGSESPETFSPLSKSRKLLSVTPSIKNLIKKEKSSQRETTVLSSHKMLQELIGDICTNVENKDRTYLLKTYKNCFVGSEIVDYICKIMGHDRKQAVEICNDLIRVGYLLHVADKARNFEDGYFFYKLGTDPAIQLSLANNRNIQNLTSWTPTHFFAKRQEKMIKNRKYTGKGGINMSSHQLKSFAEMKHRAERETLTQAIPEICAALGLDPQGKLVQNFLLEIRNVQPVEIAHPEFTKRIDKVSQICQDINNGLCQFPGVISIQRAVRGFLARKKYTKLFGNYQDTPLQRKNFAFQNLLKAERLYLDHLEWTIKYLEKPLRVHTLFRKFREELDDIFGKIVQLISVHRGVYQCFQEIEQDHPYIGDLGLLFVTIAPSLRVYASYVANIPNALNAYQKIASAESNFDTWMQAVESQTTTSQTTDLTSIIHLPLNHMANYQKALQVFYQNTSPDEPDFIHLQEALEVISNTSQKIQSIIVEAHQNKQIGSICSRLQYKFKTPRQRRLYMECSLKIQNLNEKKVAKSSEVQCYVFDDLILISQEKDKKFKLPNNTLVKFEWHIETLELVDQDPKTELKVVCNGNPFLLTFQTSSEKQEWILKLKKLIMESHSKSRVFGNTINGVLAKEKPASGIPFVVAQPLQWLQTHIKSEGLFRMSGKHSELIDLKNQIDQNFEKGHFQVDLTGMEVHSVTTVVKTFFRELSEPLFPFETYGTFFMATQLDETSKISSMKSVISLVPPPNKKIFLHLSEFLLQVAAVPENKMKISSLAIVFGPNLIKPREETVETSLNTPQINSGFQLIWENFDEFRPLFQQ